MKYAIFFNSLAAIMHASKIIEAGVNAASCISLIIAAFVSYVLIKNL